MIDKASRLVGVCARAATAALCLFAMLAQATDMQVTTVGGTQWIPLEANTIAPGTDTYINMDSIRINGSAGAVYLLHTNEKFSFVWTVVFNCETQAQWLNLSTTTYPGPFQTGKGYKKDNKLAEPLPWVEIGKANYLKKARRLVCLN